MQISHSASSSQSYHSSVTLATYLTMLAGTFSSIVLSSISALQKPSCTPSDSQASGTTVSSCGFLCSGYCISCVILPIFSLRAHIYLEACLMDDEYLIDVYDTRRFHLRNNEYLQDKHVCLYTKGDILIYFIYHFTRTQSGIDFNLMIINQETSFFTLTSPL